MLRVEEKFITNIAQHSAKKAYQELKALSGVTEEIALEVAKDAADFMASSIALGLITRGIEVV